MLAAILLQAAALPTPPPDEPFAALKGVVVEAIRDCPRGTMGEIVVCSRDRGFAEGWRAPKLVKPKPVDEPGIRIELRGATVPAPAGASGG